MFPNFVKCGVASSDCSVVCLLVTFMSHAKTAEIAEPIEMPSGSRLNCIRDEGKIVREEVDIIDAACRRCRPCGKPRN